MILSGYSHAGAINVMCCTQTLTGVEHITAFVGGMHVSGGLFERIIPCTVNEVAAIASDLLVPGCCTGWRTTHLLAARLLAEYLPVNVGTRYSFTVSGEKLSTAGKTSEMCRDGSA